MMTKVINKLNGNKKVDKTETYAEHLSIKAIKLKLNCLLNWEIKSKNETAMK